MTNQGVFAIIYMKPKRRSNQSEFNWQKGKN
nr:MAG TPA: hypothetical protein [Caudoviricetes sp.]DAT69749.1 MAG TPA: hypothetical protein [Caudoviricetes sp.]